MLLGPTAVICRHPCLHGSYPNRRHHREDAGMSELSDLLRSANVEELSTRQIAQRTGGMIGHDLVAKYLRGEHPTDPDERIVEALHMAFPKLSKTRIRNAAKVPPGEPEDWQPPPEANRLNKRQRRAVEELIRSIVAPTAASLDGATDRVTGAGAQAPPVDEEPIVHPREEPGRSEADARPGGRGGRGGRRQAR